MTEGSQSYMISPRFLVASDLLCEDTGHFEAQLQAVHSVIGAVDAEAVKLSRSSPLSLSLAREEREIGIEGSRSALWEDYNQKLLAQQQTDAKSDLSAHNWTIGNGMSLVLEQNFEDHCSSRVLFERNAHVPSPEYADYEI